jgi:hypothetical protein
MQQQITNTQVETTLFLLDMRSMEVGLAIWLEEWSRRFALEWCLHVKHPNFTWGSLGRDGMGHNRDVCSSLHHYTWANVSAIY